LAGSGHLFATEEELFNDLSCPIARTHMDGTFALLEESTALARRTLVQ
jgi:hypothetical protein